jgi:hypothetical protein
MRGRRVVPNSRQIKSTMKVKKSLVNFARSCGVKNELSFSMVKAHLLIESVKPFTDE